MKRRWQWWEASVFKTLFFPCPVWAVRVVILTVTRKIKLIEFVRIGQSLGYNVNPNKWSATEEAQKRMSLKHFEGSLSLSFLFLYLSLIKFLLEKYKITTRICHSLTIKENSKKIFKLLDAKNMRFFVLLALFLMFSSSMHYYIKHLDSMNEKELEPFGNM